MEILSLGDILVSLTSSFIGIDLKRIKRAALKETLNRELSTEAAAEYFGVSCNISEKESAARAIFNAIAKPRLVLDSVCYVRMIKND